MGTIPFPTTSAVVIRRCEIVGSIATVATARCIRVWIVRQGRIELSVGSGRRRAVVLLLSPGDIDGGIQLLLEMPLPSTGRAVGDLLRAEGGDLVVPAPVSLDFRTFGSPIAERRSGRDG